MKTAEEWIAEFPVLGCSCLFCRPQHKQLVRAIQQDAIKTCAALISALAPKVTP